MFSKFSVKLLRISSRLNHIVVGYPQPDLHVGSRNRDQKNLEVENAPTKFRMQLAKASDANPILYFLEKNFLRDDPLCKSLHLDRLKMDKVLEFHFKQTLLQGLTVIARETSRENRIIGVCVNKKNCRWDGNRLNKLAKAAGNVNARKLLHIWALISQEPAMHDHFQQLSIFNLAIISAKPPNILTELAKYSLSLGRDLNYKFARIDCRDDSTMKIAEKLAMEKLWDVPYKNILGNDEKTPVAAPEYPTTHAAAYYINLKTMPTDDGVYSDLDSDYDDSEKLIFE